MTAHFQFKSVSYAGLAPGRRLLITGAVHGNEVCGAQAIRRVIDELDAGTLRLRAGRVTFVPVTNPMAYAKGERSGDRNLNRCLRPTDSPRDFEDHIANWLCPLMAQHEVLLDLHSFQGLGRPFVMVGPRDNGGVLEPFIQAAQEEAWALRLGVNRCVDGWLSTYARGVERRIASVDALRAAGIMVHQLDTDPRYGVGTTEYMRSVGGLALTLECGQHADPQAPQVAYQAILQSLAHWGLIDAPAPAAASPIEALSIYDVIDKAHGDDQFARTWASFDPLCAGDLIGTRHDGTPVLAPDDGYILFPAAKALPGQEWFYLAKANTRWADGGGT